MTVNNPYQPVQFPVSGYDYDFTFKIDDTSEIVVYTLDEDDNPTLLVNGTDYIVTIDTVSEGGTVQTGSYIAAVWTPAEPDGENILITRNTPYTQPTDIPVRGAFSERRIEGALDHIAKQMQQLKYLLDQSFDFDPSNTPAVVQVIATAVTAAQTAVQAAADAQAAAADAAEAAWPVGSVFISGVATNPATLLGVGTWTAEAEGYALVGYKSGDPDFGTPLDTVGAKTHQLTVQEMPAHDHSSSTIASRIDNSAAGTANSAVEAQASNGDIPLNITSEGGDQEHNNIQPSKVFYIWRRTA